MVQDDEVTSVYEAEAQLAILEKHTPSTFTDGLTVLLFAQHGLQVDHASLLKLDQDLQIDVLPRHSNPDTARKLLVKLLDQKTKSLAEGTGLPTGVASSIILLRAVANTYRLMEIANKVDSMIHLSGIWVNPQTGTAILENLIKYSPEKGRINLNTLLTRGKVRTNNVPETISVNLYLGKNHQITVTLNEAFLPTQKVSIRVTKPTGGVEEFKHNGADISRGNAPFEVKNIADEISSIVRYAGVDNDLFRFYLLSLTMDEIKAAEGVPLQVSRSNKPYIPVSVLIQEGATIEDSVFKPLQLVLTQNNTAVQGATVVPLMTAESSNIGIRRGVCKIGNEEYHTLIIKPSKNDERALTLAEYIAFFSYDPSLLLGPEINSDQSFGGMAVEMRQALHKLIEDFKSDNPAVSDDLTVITKNLIDLIGKTNVRTKANIVLCKNPAAIDKIHELLKGGKCITPSEIVKTLIPTDEGKAMLAAMDIYSIVEITGAVNKKTYHLLVNQLRDPSARAERLESNLVKILSTVGNAS